MVIDLPVLTLRAYKTWYNIEVLPLSCYILQYPEARGPVRNTV